MITITIDSSQNVADIPSTAHEWQSIGKSNRSHGVAVSKASVDIVVGSNVQSVTLATRPVALERAQKTQRLNQSLEMGYVLPLKPTSSK